MPRLLILNADDLGYDPGINRGVVQAMREGVVSSATLMVNTPFSEAAAAGARDLRIGLHFNLARYAPCWEDFPRALLEDGQLVEAAASRLPSEVVAAEVEAQLGALERMLGKPATHVDVHKHLHRHPNVLEGLAASAKRRDLPVRAIDASMREALKRHGLRTTDAFVGDAGVEPYWTLEQLRVSLEQLGDGVTELMCHPGYAPTAIRTGYHVQRETELQTFLHPGAKQLLSRLGLVTGGFGDIPRPWQPDPPRS